KKVWQASGMTPTRPPSTIPGPQALPKTQSLSDSGPVPIPLSPTIVVKNQPKPPSLNLSGSQAGTKMALPLTPLHAGDRGRGEGRDSSRQTAPAPDTADPSATGDTSPVGPSKSRPVKRPTLPPQPVQSAPALPPREASAASADWTTDGPACAARPPVAAAPRDQDCQQARPPRRAWQPPSRPAAGSLAGGSRSGDCSAPRSRL